MDCHFIFCLHDHQPTGNFDHIFQWAYRDCYNKTLQVLKEYPEFRFAIHHSGCLLEWIKGQHPEYLHEIRAMRERGQIEIIGGGFYEPIFSVISESDIKGQIGLMQDFCGDEFGVKPVGFWTAERVWDPEIPRLVSDFNFKYTVLDDIHFRYAGIEAEKLYGYYLTERLDKKLGIFPIDRFLRYSIPFKMPEETINYFREKTERHGGGAFVYGDDGEKFGLWPETYKWVHDEGWLRKFIEAVLREGWIKMTHPSEYIASHPPLGRVYLTSGSYYELSEWALPPESAVKLMNINKEIKAQGREDEFYSFIKGGVWNNFLNKYHESNAINKRALLLSGEIASLEKERGEEYPDIKRELYRGECNCAYWHGLFGGIYLGNLRHALYEHILTAEKLLIDRKGAGGITVTEKDFWNEGRDQVLIRNSGQSLVVVPYAGGMISELSFYKKSFNIFDMLQRRLEAYHKVLREMNDEVSDSGETRSIHDRVAVKEKGLSAYLIVDKSRRYSFKDMIFFSMPAPEEIMFGRADVYDCGLCEYDHSIRSESGWVELELSRSVDIDNGTVAITKRYLVKEGLTGVTGRYSVVSSRNIYFGVELNINLLGGHDSDRQYLIAGEEDEKAFLDSIGSSGPFEGFSLFDRYNNFSVGINCGRRFKLIRYPVYAVSQSDSGFEKNFQGSSLLLVFELGEGKTDFDIEVFLKEGAPA